MMKNLLKGLFLICGVTLTLISCGSEGCVSCEKKLPNSTTTAEICQSGSDVTVRNTTIGVIKDETIKGTDVATYQRTLEAAGYTCK